MLQIIGNLVVQSTSATSVTFATLEHVVGHVHFQTNSVMTTLDFPQLKTIQGSGSYFYLHQNGYLNSLLVPNLEWVEGWIEIRENNAMWGINFPALISTGPDILVHDLQTGKIIDTFLFNFKLKILNESFLSHHFANISSWHIITQIVLTGPDEDYLIIYDNSNLQTITFPLLDSIGGYFKVGNNLVLASFTVPLLTVIGPGLHMDVATTRVDTGRTSAMFFAKFLFIKPSHFCRWKFVTVHFWM